MSVLGWILIAPFIVVSWAVCVLVLFFIHYTVQAMRNASK